MDQPIINSLNIAANLFQVASETKDDQMFSPYANHIYCTQIYFTHVMLNFPEGINKVFELNWNELNYFTYMYLTFVKNYPKTQEWDTSVIKF